VRRAQGAHSGKPRRRDVSEPPHQGGARAAQSPDERAGGGARSSVEQTDWHDEAERAFLRGLASRLDAAVSSGETSALTMVASPRALGMIRADYSDVVRKALQGEVGKDLVKLPVYEIEKQLLLSGVAR
jgi:protein required for attachment to host cells